MTDIDRHIGENLRRLRGERSQRGLAEAMRARGWKWSQPTVAAVETGERALKLAEAQSLLEILHLDELEQLLSRPLRVLGRNALDRMHAADTRLREAVALFHDAQHGLRLIAAEIESAAEKLPEVSGEIASWLERKPSDVAKQIHPVSGAVPAKANIPDLMTALRDAEPDDDNLVEQEEQHHGEHQETT